MPLIPTATHKTADERFQPLVDALRAAGIPNVPDSPDNTGGNVMALVVPLRTVSHAVPDGTRAYPGNAASLYMGEEFYGAGLQIGENGDFIDLWNEARTGCTYHADCTAQPADSCDMAGFVPDEGWTPAEAQVEAAWIASILPILTPWLEALEFEADTTSHGFTFLRPVDIPRLPYLPGTLVNGLDSTPPLD